MQISSSSIASMFAAPQTSKTNAMTSAGASLLSNDATDSADSSRGQFAAYMKMTPAEKMHAAMLKRLGMTEEEFKSLDPDKRAAAEAKIKDMIKQEIEESADKKQTGVLADIRV